MTGKRALAALLLLGAAVGLVASIGVATANPDITDTGSSPDKESLRVDIATLHSYFDRLEREGLSAVVLIEKDGKVLLHEAYGLARDDPRVAMTPDTILNLGSLGKQFTATLIMQLQEDGVLSLESKLGDLFDKAPPDKVEITLHQLLSHTSGLTSHDTGNDFDPMTRREAMDRIFALELAFAPGESFQYSNAGYVLLAMVIEELTGQSYLTVLEERIFNRAGMRTVGTYGDQILSKHPTAYGYRNSQETASFAEAGPLQWGAMGAGEILMTADEMRRWMGALRDKRVISPASLEQMWAPQAAMGPPGIHYGYGWRIRTETPLGLRIEHGGLGHGGNANVSYFPESDLLLIILSNRAGIDFVDGQVLGVKAPAAHAMHSLIKVIAQNDPSIPADVSHTF